MTQPPVVPSKLMQLEYPQHVAEFRTYEEAQAAVDYLADSKFAVQNILIVGTNLKLLERVTGRRTWGNVLAEGAISGIATGMLVGLMLVLFVGNGNCQHAVGGSGHGHRLRGHRPSAGVLLSGWQARLQPRPA